jgi:hypothetical protein
MIKISKMIANTTKKSTLIWNNSNLIKIAYLRQKIIKYNKLKKIDKSLKIILNLLFTAIPIKISKNSIIRKLMNSKPKIIMSITKHHCLKKNIILEMKSKVSTIKKDKSYKILLRLENKSSILLRKSKKKKGSKQKQ